MLKNAKTEGNCIFKLSLNIDGFGCHGSESLDVTTGFRFQATVACGYYGDLGVREGERFERERARPSSSEEREGRVREKAGKVYGRENLPNNQFWPFIKKRKQFFYMQLPARNWLTWHSENSKKKKKTN